MAFLSRFVRRRQAPLSADPGSGARAGRPRLPAGAPLALEPRLMFDAAAVIAAHESLALPPASEVEAPAAEAAARACDEATAVGLALTQLNARLAEGPADAAVDLARPGADTVVFVDAGLAGLDSLRASWPADVQLVLLQPGADGLAQMQAALADRQDIASLHLITHGSAGALQLGATLLQPNALDDQQAGQLAALREHLRPGADLFIYGCDFGAGLQGRAAADALATALGTDLAASTDATGSAARGGDWDLELRLGRFEQQALAAEQWDGLLLLGGVLNTPPVAVADVALVAEEGSTLINVKANDLDAEGQALTVTSASALFGSVSVQADGRLLYVPTANFFGTDTLTYTLRDSAGASALLPGTVVVTVSPVDDIATLNLPLAGTLPLLAEDTPLIFASALGSSISLGDIDGGLTTLRLSVPVGSLSLSQTAGLTLAEGDGVSDAAITLRGSLADVNAALDGLAYTPGADYHGAVQITLTVGDTLLGLVPVTTQLPLGIAAVADIVDDTVQAVAGQSAGFNVLANDSFENPSRVLSGYTLPAHGSLVIDAQGQAVYTPDPGWTGSDSFTYTVTSHGTTETATVTLQTVLGPQPPTLGLPSTQTLAEDGSLVFGSAFGRALTVADANDDVLTLQLSVSHGVLDLADPAAVTLLAGDGVADTTLTLQGRPAALAAALEGLRYTPVADFHGTATLTLQASDGSASQGGSLSLVVQPGVDGQTDTLATGAQQPVRFFPLANDAFEGPATLSGVGAAGHGTVVQDPGGQLIYTPDVGFAGTDRFHYTVSAGGASETVLVEVTVAPNLVPTAGVLAPVATVDGALLWLPAASAFADADVGDVLRYAASGLPAGLTIDANTGVIGGMVDGHASQLQGGVYTVQITATDREGASVGQTLNLSVSNPAPAAATLARTLDEDGRLTVDLATLAVDADGDGLSLGSLSALHGTVSLLPDGGLAYVPDADFHGVDEIRYVVHDADGGQAAGRIELTVQAVADLPTITLPTLPLLAEDTPIVFASLLGQRIVLGDVDGQVLQLSLSVPVGDLTLAQTAGVSISQGDGVRDGLITLSGTAADLNAALDGLVWTPGADYHGPLTLTIDLGPLAGLPQVRALLPVGIAAVADIVDDHVSVVEGRSASFDVLANDSFENPARVVGGYTLPAHGTLTLDAQGRAVYTPAAGFVGSDSFTYTVHSSGTTETATVTITVGARPNADPTGSGLPDRAASDGQALRFDLSGAFADPDGDTLSWQAAGLPAGLAIDPATGIISGTLDRSASGGGVQGAYVITVTASDGRGGSLTQAFTLQVGNPGPQAADDTLRLDEDGVAGGQVLDNDGDPDGDALRVDTVPVRAPAHGTLTLEADGRFVYRPDADFHGIDSFSYRVIDADGASAVATVTLQVDAVADAPRPVDDAVTTAEDTPVTVAVLDNDVEADGQALSVVQATALHGQVRILADGALRYLPDADFHGSDTVRYTVRDADGLEREAVLAVTVTPVNDAPVVEPLADRSGVVGTPTSLTLAGLARDPEGQGLDYAASGLPPGLAIDPSSGQISGTPQTPGQYAVTVVVRDTGGAETRQSFVWTVAAAPDNAPDTATPLAPVQADDGAALRIETAGAFQDADGDALSYAASGLPAGLAIDAQTGVISGTLAAGASSAVDGGVYTVVVTASDGRGGSASQGLTLTVGNPPPQAGDDRIVVAEDGLATGTLTANDGDPDGDALRVDTLPVLAPAHGTVTLSADGSYRYVPDPDFAGSDRFAYRLVDADGAAVTASVEIEVQGRNDAPASSPLDDRSGVAGTPVSVNLAAAFVDADGDALSYAASGLPPGLTIDPVSGRISGTPDTPGRYEVILSATDPSGERTSQTLSWTIAAPPNDSPDTVGTLAAEAASDGAAYRRETAGAFRDADGDRLTYTASGLPAGLTIDPATGVISGALAADASQAVPDGRYTVIVTADDGRGGSVQQGYTLTVGNTPPQADDGLARVDEDGTLSGDLLAAARDADGDALRLDTTPLLAPAHGTLTLGADGRYGYVPDPDYSGADRFSYRIVDADGASAVATVELTVAPVNDAPRSAMPLPDRSNTVGASVTLALAAAFGDPDGDTLRYTASGLPPGLTLDPDSGRISGSTDVAGSFAVQLQATDPSGASVNQGFVWTVAAGADNAPDVVAPLAPVRADDGQSVRIDAAAAFADADGDALRYTASGLPSGLAIDPVSGVISGTLAAGASSAVPGGVHTVVVTADDGRGGTARQGLTLTVDNTVPVVFDSTVVLTEDGLASGSLLDPALAGDADGDVLVVDVPPLVAPAHGTLTLAADGRYTYVPDPDFAGTDRFSYQVVDADGAVAVATVTITVTPVNDAPVLLATPDDRTTARGTATDLQAGVFFGDPDGQRLGYAATGLPPGLVLDPLSGEISGRPTVAGDYRVTLTATDPDGAARSVDFAWRVEAAPDNSPETVGTLAPVLARDGEAVTLATAGAFRDADGDALRYAASGLPAGLSIDPLSGVIRGTLAADASSAVPGGVHTVVVTADDGRGGLVRQGFTLTVANPAPVAVDDLLVVPEDGAARGDLLANDRDADGDALVLDTTPVVAPRHGTVTIGADGSYVYTFAPDADYTGSDSFTYRIVDADGASAEAVVRITVTPVEDPPQALPLDDRANTLGSPVRLDLSQVFSDADGDVLRYAAGGLPPGLTVDATSGLITGAGSVAGRYEVTLTATDPAGNTATVRLLWDMQALPDNSPSAVGSLPAQRAADGQSLTLDTAQGFRDPDGDPLVFDARGLPPGLTIDPVTGVIGGTLDGQASRGGGDGVYTVIVGASDGRGGRVEQGFTLSVGNVAPQAVELGVQTLAEDGARAGSLLDAVRDTAGDALRLVPGSLQGPAHGRLELTADGGYVYTPDPDYAGDDAFSFEVVDGAGATVRTEIRLEVQPVADAPLAGALPPAGGEVGRALVIDAAAVFSDADGDALSYAAEGLPPGLTIDPASGRIVGTPTLGGSYVVTVVAVDPSGLQARATLTLEVAGTGGAGAAPTARPFSLAASVDGLRLSGEYDPVLLAAVNDVQGLGGMGDLAGEQAVLGTIGAAGSLGSSVQLAAGANPMAQVVGDLSAGFKQAVRLDGGAGGAIEIGGGLAADPLRQGGQQQLDRLLADPALRDALGVAGGSAAARPLAALGELPIPLSQQLRQAEAQAAAELDALARALG